MNQTGPTSNANERTSQSRVFRTRRSRVWWAWLAVWVIGVPVSAMCAVAASKAPGVYWSRVQISFIAPNSTTNPNGLQITSSSLISAAGAVGKMVDNRTSAARLGSATVTLAGEGIRNGYSVTLPNDGGQWVSSFNSPWLDVQAVASDPLTVSQRMSALLRQINVALAHLQSEQSVAPRNLIRTQASPPSVPIYYQRGSRMRASAGTLVLGLILTTALAGACRRPSQRGQPGHDHDQVLTVERVHTEDSARIVGSFMVR